jgi:hypothetical protein
LEVQPSHDILLLCGQLAMTEYKFSRLSEALFCPFNLPLHDQAVRTCKSPRKSWLRSSIESQGPPLGVVEDRYRFGGDHSPFLTDPVGGRDPVASGGHHPKHAGGDLGVRKVSEGIKLAEEDLSHQI